MKKIILTVIILIAIEAVGWTVFVFSGSYNVSTANHDNGFINWWLDTGATRSVKHHARGIKVPDLENPALVQEGFKHYEEMCVQCHGAPGKPADEIAKGMWPEAPALGKTAQDWSSAQVFWIIKNGIKFSAMPGWGATHDDHKLWAITAFVEKMPKLSPADYQQMKTNTIGTGHHGNDLTQLHEEQLHVSQAVTSVMKQ